MLRARCEQCGTSFAAETGAVLEKSMLDHNSRFHGNKNEQILQLAKSAKAMAFAFVNGAVPRRKDARALVSLSSQILNEPIPDMPEEQSPKDGKVGEAGTDAPKGTLPSDGATPESKTETDPPAVPTKKSKGK
jgi:hypothetical protein